MSAEHRISTLDSGVRVVSERVPGVRSVALGFWVATGSVNEDDAHAGISHLLEHMLFRGTERYGSREIDQIFDSMGAEVNAGTDKEATSLYTRVLDRHLEHAFDVMGEMIWRPVLGELEAEREVVLEEIAMYEDDPQDRVFDVLGKAIFGSHPLGRAVIGSAEVIAGVTREQLAAFHAERYRPQSVVIAAAGSVDHEALLALARGAEPPAGDVGAKAPNGRPRRRSEPGAPAPAASAPRGTPACALQGAPDFRKRTRFLQKDTEQYHVCVGEGGSRERTSAASRCACSKACSAARPPRGSSRRCASAGGWPTRSSASPTCTPTRARSGCTWAHARTKSARR